jgi:hypothetical protein
MPKLAILLVATSICLPAIFGGISPTSAPAGEGTPNVRLADIRPLTQLQFRRHAPKAPQVPPNSMEETQFA